jgi:serine phosphatase RsbU (regulator of sigma subunit)
MAVRYWAAGEAVEVGGDFYDVFPLDADHWGVVIGDVCGTGPVAAGITAFARHTIADAAWHGDGPSAVLERLNRSMRYRYADQFCTVCYATLRGAPGGAALCVVAGGHPPPLLVRPGAPVTACGAPGTLLGVFDAVALHEVETELRPGDRVVFYTDGVTDVPPPHQLPRAELAELLGRLSSENADLEAFVTSFENALAGILGFDRRDDDIALLVVEIAGPVSGPGDGPLHHWPRRTS